MIVVRRRYERLMRTFAAFDLGLAADALDPLVGARGRIAGPPRPGVLPPHRKDIRPTGEQATKQGELLGGRRTAGDRRIVERGGACGIIGRRQLALEIGECRLKARRAPHRVQRDVVVGARFPDRSHPCPPSSLASAPLRLSDPYRGAVRASRFCFSPASQSAALADLAGVLGLRVEEDEFEEDAA